MGSCSYVYSPFSHCSLLGFARNRDLPAGSAAADQEKPVSSTVVPSAAPTQAAAEEEQASPPPADEAHRHQDSGADAADGEPDLLVSGGCVRSELGVRGSGSCRFRGAGSGCSYDGSTAQILGKEYMNTYVVLVVSSSSDNVIECACQVFVRMPASRH
uniref:Uncharacterized protein n=1 Tax=Oryza punctata TaxID=4537 RepID=A0A0E0MMK3_ORYPU